MGFIRKLINEILLNGKMLLGYLMVNIPELNAYPMLKGALEDFFAHPTLMGGLRLLAQVVLAGGAGHRLIKIIKAALEA